MAKSSIQITFNEEFVAGSSISFTHQIGGNTPTTITETWVSTIRQAPNTVSSTSFSQGEIQEPQIIEFTVINYIDALLLDYGNILDAVLVSSDKILITAKNYNVIFSNFNASGNDATEVINNIDFEPFLAITSLTFTEATVNNKCDYVKVNITANKVVNQVTSPITLSPNASSFSFEYLRNTTSQLIISQSTEENTSTLKTPAKLSKPVVNVITTPSGGNIEVSAIGVDNLEYSIDNTTWKTDNNFTNLAVGNYTMYVKDTFGCKKSIAFIVGEFKPLTEEVRPIAYIDEENPILFKELQEIDGIITLKTLKNSLSCEIAKHSSEINNCFTHLRQIRDIESIQILNTYENISAYIQSENGKEYLIPDLKEKLTKLEETINCTIYSNNGKVSIYFDELPSWASKVGLPVFVGELNTYALIESVYFDDLKGKDVINFTNNYTDIEKITTAKVIYNKMPFDIYELKFDYLKYQNEDVYLVVEFTDSVFGAKTLVSELINVKEKQDDTLEVRYKSSENGNIMYASTGVWFQTRLKYEPFEPVSELGNENEKTDTNITSISSDRIEKWKIKFPFESLKSAQHLEQIFGLDIIEIEREQYKVAKRTPAKRLGYSGMSEFEVELYKLNTGFQEKPVNFVNKYISHALLTDGDALITDNDKTLIII